MDISRSLAKADEATLKEIVRNAESYLSAQLTAALAGNQRAMTFTGMVAAAALLIGGAVGASLSRQPADRAMSVIGLLVLTGMLVSMWKAILVAKPTGFFYVGNEPSKWVEDVDAGKSFEASLAEQCAHYDDMIASNARRMEKSDKLIVSALWWAWGSLLMGGLLTVTLIVLRVEGAPF